MALTDKLSAIGNAIREKTGGTELLTLDQMANEIANIQGGGSGDFPSEITIPNTTSGNSAKIFNYRDNISWLIDLKIPIKFLVYDPGFQFSDSSTSLVDASYLTFILYSDSCWTKFFGNCQSMTNMPKVYFTKQGSYNLQSHFAVNCYLRDIPADYFYVKNENGVADLNTPILSNDDSASYWDFSDLFASCYSLRNLPKLPFYTPDKIKRTYFSSMFYNCASLDKVEDFLVPLNMEASGFDYIFYRCFRLKDFTFTTDNGVPKVVNWKNQEIDLSNYVGYSDSSSVNTITRYNSGITEDKAVYDDATYQALKDDPDWFSTDINYSRYNHNSAVNTINSLPDTSAYLATAGGTNTIKFKGQSGASTDGGAINTLTEEEIAVATAKGWTVSLV